MHWLERATSAPAKKSRTKLPEAIEATVVKVDKVATGTAVDHYAEFLSVLKSNGFLVDSIQVTGDTPVRVDVEGAKAGSRVGWYYFKIIGDAAFGTFGDWREGGHQSWSSYGDDSIDEKKREEIRAEMERQIKVAQEERDKLRKAAEKFIRSKYAALNRVGKNRYIDRKKIRDAIAYCDIRSWGKSDNSNIVIPMYDAEGDIKNWQIIDESGNKRFKKFASVKGRFHIIGDIDSSNSVTYCEGFATGCSIYLATSMPVIVCFNAGNMLPVMHETKDIVSGKTIYIAADNDKVSKTGQKAAEKCKETFPSAEIVMSPYVGQDLNDLHCNGGRAEPKESQIKKDTVEKDGLDRLLELFQEKGYEKPAKKDIRIWDGEEIADKIPDELLQFPSDKMNELADAVESFGVKTSRQISMMGALTLACGIAGRNFMEEEKGNFSTIMSCVIAPSGAGKDYPKKFISSCLNKSDKLQDFIGSASYTSEAAIRNQLIQHPVKISILDEFGDKLSRAIKGFGRDVEAFDAFKEIYSDCRGVWAGRAYAMQDLSGSKKDLRSEPINNPSLTILGLSTPQQFVDAISDSQIEGGFLNRFVIVDASKDEINRKRRLNRKTPDWLIEHLELIANRGGKVLPGNLGNLALNIYSQEANPVEIGVSEEVSDLFWEFDEYILNEFTDDSFMTNMAARWVENAIRISVGISVFENPKNPKITTDIAEWAISFVQFHGRRTAKLMVDHSYINEHHRMRNKCLEVIRSKRDKGLAKSEMNRLMPFRGMEIKYRDKILSELVSMGYVGVNIRDDINYMNKVVYYAYKM